MIEGHDVEGTLSSCRRCFENKTCTSNHKAPPLVGGVAEYSILPLATLQLLAGVLYSNVLSVQYFGSLLQRLLAARLAKVCMSDSNASYPLRYD